ncbi:MFS transporter [Pseudomonas putida]
MKKHIRQLSFSMLISSAGTTLFVSALALSLYHEQASASKATGVYIAQFLPIIFLLPIAIRLCDSLSIRRGLVSLELSSAALTLGLGLCIGNGWLWVVYILLAIRGFLELTTKTLRNVALKRIADPADLDKANNLIMGSSFLGQAFGALLGFWLVDKYSLLNIAIFDSATFLISALICTKLPTYYCQPSQENSLHQAVKEIQCNPKMKAYFIYLSLTVIFLQSYNQVARTLIPLDWLNLGLERGIAGEIVSCFGIFTGLLLVNFWFPVIKLKNYHPPLALLIGALALLTPFLTREPILSLSLYFTYMSLFEISLMVAMNGLLATCPLHRVAAVMGLFYALSFGAMTLVSFAIAYFTDSYSLPYVALGLTTVILLTLLITFFTLNHRSPPPSSVALRVAKPLLKNKSHIDSKAKF